MTKPPHTPSPIDRIVAWVGSIPSVLVHTGIFVGFFLITISNLFPRDTVLLVWNTAVSLEAIYLAIFIQFTVNRNTESLRGVEEDIDEIQEDVEELGEDLDEIQEDIEEMSEDVEEMQEDLEELSEEDAEEEKQQQAQQEHVRTLEQLTDDIRGILNELENIKKK
jgi:uncharacterized protein (DUF3084 family)